MSAMIGGFKDSKPASSFFDRSEMTDSGPLHPNSDATGEFGDAVFPDRIRYVVGFMFDNVGVQVVLIRKEKPDWQKGKLNGVGGKIEDGESPIDAMRREFIEETGVLTHDDTWREFAVLDCFNPGVSRQATVHFFVAFDTVYLKRVTTKTDEHVDHYDVDMIRQYANKVPNLQWLIPLALSCEVQQLHIKEIAQ